MIYTYKDIIIRQANREDATRLAKWWADGKVMAHAGFPKGLKTDIDKLCKRIDKQHEQIQSSDLLMIIEHANYGPIGEMNYRLKDQGVYEIGIKICDFHLHRKGYGKIAIALLVKHLFQEIKAMKIVLSTNLTNKQAQAFYKALGFKQTHIEKDAWIDQIGQKQSAVYFQLSKDDALKLFKYLAS